MSPEYSPEQFGPLDTTTIGTLLRSAREGHPDRLSLNQFAELVGIDSAYISKAERDIVPASIPLLNAYCHYCFLARLFVYEKAGVTVVDQELMDPDTYELVQDLFNEGQIYNT